MNALEIFANKRRLSLLCFPHWKGTIAEAKAWFQNCSNFPFPSCDLFWNRRIEKNRFRVTAYSNRKQIGCIRSCFESVCSEAIDYFILYWIDIIIYNSEQGKLNNNGSIQCGHGELPSISRRVQNKSRFNARNMPGKKKKGWMCLRWIEILQREASPSSQESWVTLI